MPDEENPWDEGERAWQQLCRRMTPLKNKGRYISPEQSAKNTSVKSSTSHQKSPPFWVEKDSLVLNGLKKRPKPTGHDKELTVNTPDNVSRSSAKHLFAGKYSFSDKLDLHGYTQDRAFDALTDFILSSYQKQYRCVLVITGKGGMGDRKGVLYTQVPKWLNHPKIKPMILMFSHARPKDGGDGALYILLKKNK